MRFTSTDIEDLWLVELEPITDHRGFFARVWCEDEFADHGLRADWKQFNLQFSPEPGTLRGFHYQIPPHGETKYVRCTAGAICDVAIDLRPTSSTYLRWSANVITAEDRKSVWVPSGCAHAYLTLEANSEAVYMASTRHTLEAVRGIRHDDPAFAIDWPRPVESVAEGSREWPDFDPSDPYFWPQPERSPL